MLRIPVRWRWLIVICVWVTGKSAVCADSGLSSYIPDLSGVGAQLSASLPLVDYSPTSQVTAITYRLEDGRIRELAVLSLPRPASSPTRNSQAGQLPPDLRDVVDDWVKLFLQPVGIHAAPGISQSHQRAWSRAIAGDLGLLRELTVEPLHVVVIMPEPDPYLPPSLRDKVQAMVLTGALKLTLWEGSVHFLGRDPGDAARVASTILAWQELLGTLAGEGAGDPPAPWKNILRSVQLETNATAAILSASVPAPLLQRVARLITASSLLGE